MSCSHRQLRAAGCRVRANGGGLPRWQQVNAIPAAWSRRRAHHHQLSPRVWRDELRHSGRAGRDGEERFANWHDLGRLRGAQGLKEYLTLGYVPDAVSVTLEYGNADYAIAQFARALVTSRNTPLPASGAELDEPV